MQSNTTGHSPISDVRHHFCRVGYQIKSITELAYMRRSTQIILPITQSSKRQVFWHWFTPLDKPQISDCMYGSNQPHLDRFMRYFVEVSSRVRYYQFIPCRGAYWRQYSNSSCGNGGGVTGLRCPCEIGDAILEIEWLYRNLKSHSLKLIFSASLSLLFAVISNLLTHNVYYLC